MKTLGRHQLTLSMSMSCVEVVLSNRVSLPVCGEQSITLAAGWVVWGVPIWSTAQIDTTPSQYWKVHLVMRMFKSGSASSIIWRFYFDHLHKRVYIFAKLQRFAYCSQWPLISVVSPSMPSLFPSSPMPGSILPFVPLLPSVCSHLFYLPFQENLSVP